MNYRNFGKHHLKCSEIGFGAWAIGGMWGPQRDTDSLAALHRALDLGCNFIDTAAGYGNGRSEKLIGHAVRRRRPGAGARRRLGGDENFFLFSGGGALAEHLGDQFLAAAVAVAGGGVDEVAAEVEGAVQRGELVGVGLCAPGAADGPGAKTDFGAFKAVLAKGAVMHGAIIETCRPPSASNRRGRSEWAGQERAPGRRQVAPPGWRGQRR